MLRTLGWVIWLFGYLISRLPLYWRTLWLGRKGRAEEHDAMVQKQVSLWSGRLLHHIKMNVAVSGAENLPEGGETVVFASNHQSFLDIPVLLSYIKPPPPLMARRGIFKVPMLGGWMRQLGCVVVDRDDARAAMSAMKEADAVLKGGSPLIIFPEGTRAQDGVMGPFQPGAVRIAAKAGVPIVPVAIEGTYRGLEGNGFRVKPAKVRLTFLPQVETAGLSREAQRALPETLQDMIRAAQGAPREAQA